MKVFKYVLPMPDEYNISRVDMPFDSDVLSVEIQYLYGFDQIVVWAAVEELNDVKSKPFIVVNTGRESMFANRENFIGTVISSNGIAWHIFEPGRRRR
jgi:hypothetical protein